MKRIKQERGGAGSAQACDSYWPRGPGQPTDVPPPDSWVGGQGATLLSCGQLGTVCPGPFSAVGCSPFPMAVDCPVGPTCSPARGVLEAARSWAGSVPPVSGYMAHGPLPLGAGEVVA